ncbi:MAG: phosphoribosyltransferase [bacterium]
MWRGGSAVGLVVQECLATLGIATDHIALRTSYQGRAQYELMAAQKAPLRVHGKQYLLENLNSEDRLLIVDDVFSSGRHTGAVIDELTSGLKRNLPTDIRVATLWWRPQAPGRSPQPDYYLHETQQWLVLPYELDGLSDAEVREHKPFMLDLL